MDTSDVQVTKQPLKIGGWLILVAIGVVLSPIRLLMLMGTTYPGIFMDGTWEILTIEGSASYSPIWAPFLLGEIFVNAVFLILGLYLAYLFFTKKASLPKWYLGLALCSSVFIVVDAYIVTLVLPEAEVFDQETLKEFFRSLVSLLIWSPYLLLSQRAKDTFINPN